MDSIDVLNPAKIEGPPSAMIQRVSVFEPLLAQPADDFVIGDDRGVSSFGNFDSVGDMVEMTVRNQDVVGLDLSTLSGFASGFGVINGSKRRDLPPN